MSSPLKVALPGGEEVAVIAPWAKYVKGESRVRFRLEQSLKPYVLGLKEYFARVPVMEACQLRSGYAISFYLYCLSWHESAQRGWSMTVDQLREWLSIPPGTLQRVCDINNRVIGQARRELDQKASISFRPRPIREGRGTGGWFFEVVDNKPKPKRRRPLPPAEPTPGLSDEELARGRAMLAELKAKVQKAA